MTDIDINQIKKITKREKEKKEKREAEAEKNFQREKERLEKAWAQQVIDSTEEKIVLAAQKGDSGVIAVSDSSSTSGFGIIEQHFISKGFKTSRREMKPFGSDPLYPYPVHSLYVSWND